MNNFVLVSQIMAKIREKFKEKMEMLSQQKHRETTKGARIRHEATIKKLAEKMHEYTNPIHDGTARHLKTGIEIDDKLVQDIIRSTDVGETGMKQVIEYRLVESGEVSFFSPIPNPILQNRIREEEGSATNSRCP